MVVLVPLIEAFWSECRWRACREIAEKKSEKKYPLPSFYLLLSWVVISFSLPCALVETFLRQAAAEFEEVSLSLTGLAFRDYRGVFFGCKQTMDWNWSAAHMNGGSIIFKIRSVMQQVFQHLCFLYSSGWICGLYQNKTCWLINMWNNLQARNCKGKNMGTYLRNTW